MEGVLQILQHGVFVQPIANRNAVNKLTVKDTQA